MSEHPLPLRGQTAVVTGAAAGIGEAIARRLARSGATIAVADLGLSGARNVAQSIGCESFPIEVDVSQVASVESATEKILATTGKIHVLVNNAGIAGRAAPIWEQTDDDWHRAIAVNMTGVFNFCRSVLPHMRGQSYGRIVNVASIAGKEGNPRMAPYSATKAAVIGLTKALGKEVATDGICVNAVSPAVIQTKLLDQLTPAQVSYMTERIPMRRTGTPDEVAAVVHFLCTPECSFVTGQCYDASGGRATY